MENEAAQQPQSPAASPVMSRRAREANPFRAMVFGEQADKMIAQGTSVIKLSLGEPDFGLDSTALVVEVEWHQGVAGAFDLADQAIDLCRVEQEFARSGRVGFDVGRSLG